MKQDQNTDVFTWVSLKTRGLKLWNLKFFLDQWKIFLLIFVVKIWGSRGSGVVRLLEQLANNDLVLDFKWKGI